MAKVALVCPARTVLQIMVSHFSANVLYDVVSTSLPQDPELPVQREMFLVLHWRQDLPHTLASSSWELSKLFFKRHIIVDLEVSESWLYSALGFALQASQRQRGKVGYFYITVQLKIRPNRVRNNLHKNGIN